MSILLAHQAVTHPNTVVGTPVQCGANTLIRVECYHGFNEAAANTNPGRFLVQTSLMDTGNEDWTTVVPFVVATGTPADEVLTATEPVGEKVMAVALTAGFAANDLIYIRDATVANSEWALVQRIVANTSINLVDGLTREHALTTTTIFGSAERFAVNINVTACQRLRVVYLHEGAAAADSHIFAQSFEV